MRPIVVLVQYLSRSHELHNSKHIVILRFRVLLKNHLGHFIGECFADEVAKMILQQDPEVQNHDVLRMLVIQATT